MQKYNKYLLLGIILTIFLSCKFNGKYDIDVSDIDVNIKITRFDKKIYSLTEDNYREGLKEIQFEYPLMFELYIEGIAMTGRVRDTLYIQRFKPLVLDRYVKELYRDVLKKFPDLEKAENQLNEAFKHVKFYFPEDTIPEVYSMVSNLSYYGCVTYENLLVVSLDMFMGSDYIYYPGKWPDYKVKMFREEYMVSDMMKAYFETNFPKDEYIGKTLLSQMIYKGKRLHFLDIMMPELHDSIKIKYSKDQLKWCEKNDGELWHHLVTEKSLFETDDRKTCRFFSDGPFTNVYGVPHDSPPRLGEWVGWQIVKSYVKNNKKRESLSIFYEKDEQKILTLAKYKPKI